MATGGRIAAGDSARVETLKRLIVVMKVEEFHQQMGKMVTDRGRQTLPACRRTEASLVIRPADSQKRRLAPSIHPRSEPPSYTR